VFPPEIRQDPTELEKCNYTDNHATDPQIIVEQEMYFSRKNTLEIGQNSLN